MDYLSDNFSSRKRKVAGSNNAIEGELVTPTPEKYTKPKALPNETFIEGQKASTDVVRPNPQIGQTQPTLPKPNALNGELVTQTPASFKPTPTVQKPIIDGQVSRPVATVNPVPTVKTSPLNLASSPASNSALTGDLLAQNPATFNHATNAQGSVIEGQVLRPTLGAQPVVNTVNPLNTGSAATPQIPQIAQKPALPPYQPAVNPVNQYGSIPPNNPPVANAGGVAGTTPPAQSIATRCGNGASKLGAAMPAIQAGMNASNIMNQEANFANKIHAGSIADPNFGNEIIGSAPQKSFSRTQTPAAKPVTGDPVVGRGGTPVVPEQFITSRAGRIENPAYTEYMKTHLQKATVTPTNQATPLTGTIPKETYGNQAAISPADTRNRFTGAVESSSQMSPVTAQSNRIPTLGTKQPAAVVNPNQEGLDAIEAYKRGDKGTGWIKKDGKESFIKSEGGISKIYDSDGKFQREIDANKTYMHGANGGTMSISGAPSMKSLSSKQDMEVLDKLAAQRESGAITAAQASQIYADYKQDTAPLDQQPKMAMQRMAAKGNIDAAKQLTGDAEQQSLGQYRKDTTDIQRGTQNLEKQKYTDTRESPVSKLADKTAQNSLNILSDDPTVSAEAYRKYKLTNPTKMEKVKVEVHDPDTGQYLGTREELKNPYRETNTTSQTPTKNKLPPPKTGDTLKGTTADTEKGFKIGEVISDNVTGEPAYRKIADNTWLNLVTGEKTLAFNPN